MRTVALTGNVAAGKSTVAALFRRWGATIIDADAIVRELQEPGMPVHAAIVARFGTGIVAGDGRLDRGALRTQILADPVARADLNRIVHPAVLVRRAELARAAAAAGARILINDIPLLFEIGLDREYDIIVLVDAPESERRRRMIDDRGLAAGEAEALIRAQMPSRDKRARSTYVIDNDADLATLGRRTGAVWEALAAAIDTR